MSVDVNDESGFTPALDLAEVSALATYVLDHMRVHPQAELNVILADEASIERLHVDWLDLPGPTDVLSFPMDELRPAPPGEQPQEGMLGDIVVCPQRRARPTTPAIRRPRRSSCSSRTASCICWATTTPRRTSARRCSTSSAGSC